MRICFSIFCGKLKVPNFLAFKFFRKQFCNTRRIIAVRFQKKKYFRVQLPLSVFVRLRLRFYRQNMVSVNLFHFLQTILIFCKYHLFSGLYLILILWLYSSLSLYSIPVVIVYSLYCMRS